MKPVNMRAAMRPAIAAAFCTMASLSAYAALGTNQAVEYLYVGNKFDHASGSNRGGSYDGPTDTDFKISFSFLMTDFIQPGQAIDLSDRLGFFKGVMGDGGQFSSWSFSWCDDYKDSCFGSTKMASGTYDDQWWMQRSRMYNVNQPGTWQVNIVDAPPSSAYYGLATPVGREPSVVPEPRTGVMAILGLAAVGALARRQTKTQAPAHAA